ncbi:MAG: helix-turn-helix domain-containing protein [Treponema sp.]|jgi:transposase|nr:helix-turn-helix domain-containing protein [Treponema sp.]
MAGKLPMGQKELLRGKVMELVKRGQMTIRAAAKELKISYRQGRRIYAAYEKDGDQGIIHGNTGKRSSLRRSKYPRKANRTLMPPEGACKLFCVNGTS